MSKSARTDFKEYHIKNEHSNHRDFPRDKMFTFRIQNSNERKTFESTTKGYTISMNNKSIHIVHVKGKTREVKHTRGAQKLLSSNFMKLTRLKIFKVACPSLKVVFRFLLSFLVLFSFVCASFFFEIRYRRLTVVFYKLLAKPKEKEPEIDFTFFIK